jgi:sirohydrochlorin cobaltochelatase
MSTAYLLLSHGSRDPRPQRAIDLLCQQLAARLPESIVGSACLELAEEPLSTQLINFINGLSIEIDRLKILPLFLLPGVHVMEDIPTQIDIARSSIDPRIKIDLAPYIGTRSALFHLLHQQRQQLPADTLLLSHGSRRTGGNTPIEEIANKLNINAIYWSVEPSLNDGITQLIDRGIKSIGILPYFLFTGGITDAIGDRINQIQIEYPDCHLILGRSIGNEPEFIEIIIDLLTDLSTK